MKLSTLVEDGKKVTFKYCHNGEVWLTCENGFLFPMPLSGTTGFTIYLENEAGPFLPWIRKYACEIGLELD